MIDKTKQYTCEGREVRIYATDGAGALPVHGAVKYDGGWINIARRSDGTHPCSPPLVEVRPERTAWVNVYSDERIYLYESRAHADEVASMGRIACVKLTYRLGQGL